MNRVRWFVGYTLALAFFVAIGPFIGWYAHLLWRALNYGWNA